MDWGREENKMFIGELGFSLGLMLVLNQVVDIYKRVR